MLIGVACTCGEQISVMDVYAGGHVRCPKCGGMVHVEGEPCEVEAKFRFSCPHCSTRVTARKASVGKRSKCPACQREYVVPKPPPEKDAFANVVRKRIDLDVDELGQSTLLPFTIGKTPNLEPRARPVTPVRPTPATTGELRVLGAESNGRTVPLGFSRFIVGRDKDCDLRLQSPTVSRHHCVLKRDEFTVRVRDLGSRNGTLVNGERITAEVILHDGDEVQIGDATIQMSLPHAPAVKRNGADTDLSISDFVII